MSSAPFALPRRARIACASFLLTAALFAATALSASAQSGLQITPDGQRTLISKDLAAQRWAITLNADDGTVTGNVFAADGGPPSFVWCSETARTDADITFACSGADPCPLAPCPADEWSFIAEATLPHSFFQPRSGDGAASSSALGRPAQLGAVQGGVAGRSSGVQPSLDGKRVLISKDVGDQRWVIVWNEDDGTLTGNVFFPGGGEPAFVWCLARGREGGQIQFTCHGADRCEAPPCERDAWTEIANTVLPVSFLEPPSQLEAADLAAAARDDFGGEDEAFAAILLAHDRGYSMRQIARAVLVRRLDEDGSIQRKDGSPEAPALTPTNLLSQGSASRLASPAQDSDLVRVICDAFASSLPADKKLEVLVRLLGRGYTAEQIIRVAQGEAGITLCDGAPTPQEFQDCVQGNGGSSLGLVDEGGPVEPGGPTENDVLIPEAREGCNRDGIQQPGEECDGVDLNDQTCTSLRLSEYVGGQLRCDSQCRFDESLCRRESQCADGERDIDEDCDGTDLGNATCQTVGALKRDDRDFTGGVLGCTNNPDGKCVYDTSGCIDDPDCGNGRVERGEDCDVGQLRGATCTNLANFAEPGENPPEFIGGRIGCNTGPGEDCSFDFSDCRRSGSSICGDGDLDPGEDCEIGKFGNRTCVTEGFVGGELECIIPSDGGRCEISIDNCRRAVDSECGDGQRDSGEVCDIGDLNGETCVSQGFVAGELDCFIPSDPTRPCRFDTNRCRDRTVCNNGEAEGDVEDEECDQRDFRGETCASLGLGDPRGTLECNPQTCKIDRENSCKQAQRCLNNVAEGTEQCDREDLRGQDCTDRGFDFGTLACGGDCEYDTSGCGSGCETGEKDCDGFCIPIDTECCGGGNFCTFGTVCVGSNSCCPEALPQACGDTGCIAAGADCCNSSGQHCSPGSVCTGLGTCCPAEFPQPCGDRCISAGAVCCGGNACAPGSSCCGGSCLAPGETCCGGTNPCSGGTCCGSACVPFGSDCCAPNVACSPGFVCTNISGVCCPSDAPIPCVADQTCRPLGSTCP